LITAADALQANDSDMQSGGYRRQFAGFPARQETACYCLYTYRHSMAMVTPGFHRMHASDRNFFCQTFK